MDELQVTRMVIGVVCAGIAVYVFSNEDMTDEEKKGAAIIGGMAGIAGFVLYKWVIAAAVLVSVLFFLRNFAPSIIRWVYETKEGIGTELAIQRGIRQRTLPNTLPSPQRDLDVIESAAREGNTEAIIEWVAAARGNGRIQS